MFEEVKSMNNEEQIEKPDRFKLKKDEFDLNYNKEEEIRDDLDKIEVDIKSYKLNPDTRNFIDMHDMIDNASNVCTQLFKLKKKALTFKSKAKLFVEDINYMYERESDNILLKLIDGEVGGEVDGKKEKERKKYSNAKEKEAYIRNEMREQDKYKYVQYANKRDIIAKGICEEIDSYISAIEAIRAEFGKKIELMKLQKDLGVLISIKRKVE
jgi:hypothetical protein